LAGQGQRALGAAQAEVTRSNRVGCVRKAHGGRTRTGITEPPVTKPRFLAYVPGDRFLEWKLTDTDTSRNGVSV